MREGRWLSCYSEPEFSDKFNYLHHKFQAIKPVSAEALASHVRMKQVIPHFMADELRNKTE